MGERPRRGRRTTSRTPTTSSTPPAAGGPDWHLSSVVYEIFPDRFAIERARASTRPAGRCAADGTSCPEGRSPNTARELFGGDLRGVEQHLDHIERLGANVIYLTPFFPAGSTHRYDATTFGRVDPLLGGDEALDGADAGGARTRDPGGRRLDAQSHGRRARVVPRSAGRRDVGRARLLLLRRLDALRLRGLVGDPVAAEAEPRLARARAAARRGHEALARASLRPRRLADRRRQHGRPLPRRGSRARAGRIDAGCGGAGQGRRAPRRRARLRLPRRPPRRRLARGDELRRVHAPGLVLAPRRPARRAEPLLLGLPGRDGNARRPRRGRGDARVRGRNALEVGPALVDARRQPRQRPVRDRGRLTRPPARRHRHADGAAGGADGLRRRRARPRGRVGGGRAPDDALGPPGKLGHRTLRRATAS